MRINIAWLSYIWKDKRLSLSIKLRVYLALVQSVLLYASETWTLAVADSKSLDAFHMKCQRGILGISWHQFMRNETVAALTGLYSLSDTICRRRSAIVPAHKALRTCISLSLGRLPDPSWKRRPGRPHGRWIDQFRRDNSQPPADLWRQAINRGHSGRATQQSSDYAATWPDPDLLFPVLPGYDCEHHPLPRPYPHSRSGQGVFPADAAHGLRSLSLVPLT